MRYDRLRLMNPNLSKIQDHTILIFGLGGVGGHLAEAIARTGYRRIILVDKDTVEITNLNRQLVALTSTIGKTKTSIMEERIHDIDPSIEVVTHGVEVNTSNVESLISSVDFVCEAIDDLSAKVAIAKVCQEKQIPLLASMGFANKFDPSKITLSKLNQTSVDPLAKAYRTKLRQSNLSLDGMVVFSTETPHQNGTSTLGSNAFVPASAGLYMASYVYDYFAKKENQS